MGIGALTPLLVRQLASYLRLGAAAAAEFRGACARRALMLVLGMVTGFAGIMALWAAGLVAVWNSPWRLAYAIVTAVALLVVAAVAMNRALSATAPGPSASALKNEVQKDLELLLRSADGDADAFPRSEVMRSLLDARKRRLALGIITAAWMFMGRRRPRWL